MSFRWNLHNPTMKNTNIHRKRTPMSNPAEYQDGGGIPPLIDEIGPMALVRIEL